MADLKGKFRSMYTRLVGGDEAHVAVVEPKNTAGAEEALHVIADIATSSGGMRPVYFNNYFTEYDNTEFILLSTGNGSLIYEHIGEGEFDHFWAEVENEKQFLIVVVDGVKVMEVDLAIFHNAGVDKNYSPSPNMPVVYENNQKTVNYRPRFPVYFSSSIQIYLRTYDNKKIKSWTASLVKY